MERFMVVPVPLPGLLITDMHPGTIKKVIGIIEMITKEVVKTLILSVAAPVGGSIYVRVQSIGIPFAVLMARSTGSRSARIQSRHPGNRSPRMQTRAKSRHYADPVSPSIE